MARMRNNIGGIISDPTLNAFKQEGHSTLLKQMIRETEDRRIDTAKLAVTLCKLSPTLTKAKEKKIAEQLTHVLGCIETVNTMPYAYFNLKEWKEKITLVHEQVLVLRELLEGLLTRPNKDLDTQAVTIAIKAIDDLYI